MSKVIDSRVVEMSFDNTNFEKNVSQSMSTLDKLKAKLKGLDDTSTNLDKVGEAANNIDLSKLDTALDNINSRFSTMGVIGTTVLQDLTKSAMGLVKSFGSNLWGRTIWQIKSGGKSRALNIAEAQFRIEGLGLEYEKYYDSIDQAVTGTAYGFDEAAVAASQFASSGVKAGEEMDRALRGISGMAAMTGRSYSDLAGVMEDAAAAGKVTNDTFSRLAERGLSALQTYAERTGQSVDEVRKKAKAGSISFAEFAKVMDEAYGEHATKADETFTGVTSNIRAQLSRIGQTFYQPLIANNSDLVKMLGSVKAKIKELKTYTDPFAERMANYVLKLTRIGKGLIDSINIKKAEPVFQNLVKIFDNITNSAENLFTNVISPFFKEIKKAFYDVFPDLDNGKSLLVTITDKVVEFTGKIRETSKHMGILGEKGSVVRTVFRGIFTVFKTLINILEALLPLLSKIGSIASVVLATVANVISSLGNLIVQFVPTFKMIGSYLVQGIAYGILVGIPSLFKTIVSFVTMVVEKFQSLFIIHSPSALMALMVGLPIALGIAMGIAMGIEPIKKAMGSAFTTILDAIANFTQTKAYKAIEKIFGGISSTTIALFDALSSVLFKIAEAVRALDATKLFEHIQDIERFFILGALALVMFQLLKASNWFAGAMYNFSSAIHEYVYGRFSVWSKIPDMFKSLALAFTVITGCIIVLSKLPYNQMLQGLSAFGIILLGLTGIVVLLGALSSVTKSFNWKNMKGIGLIFLSLSFAIGAMVAACVLLKDTDIYILSYIVTAMLAMTVALAGLVYVAGRFGGKGVKTAKLIGYVVALSLLINAFAKVCLIAAIVPNDIIVKAISVMAGLSIMMTASIGLLTLANRLMNGNGGAKYSKGSFDGLASAFLGFAVAMAILVHLIKVIGKIKTNELNIGVSTILMLMGFTALCLSLVTALSSIGGGGTGKLIGAALALAAMAAVMWIISDTVRAIGQMDQSEINKAMNVIGSIMGLIIVETLAMVIAAKAVGVALLGLAAMVAAMAGAVYLLGSMEDGVLQGFALLGAILVACSIINRVISRLVPADYNPVYKMFLGLAGIVAASAGFIYLIGKLSWEEMTRGSLALGVLFLGIMAIIRSLQTLDLKKFNKNDLRGTVKIFKQVAKSIITIAATVALIGIALNKFTDDPYQALITGVAAVGMAMIVLIGLVEAMQGLDPKAIKHMDKLAKTIRSISGAILIIAGSIGLLSLIPDPKGLLIAAGSIAIVLAAMALVIAACRTVDKNADVKWGAIVAALFGVLAVAAAITVLATLIADKGWENVRDAVLYLLGTLAAIALSLALLKYFDVGFDEALTLIAGTCTLLIAAAAFGMLLDQLGNRDWVTLNAIATSMLLAIAAVVGGMYAITTLIKGSAANAGYAILATVLLGVLCGELILVANALTSLANYNWSDIEASMSYILGTMIVLVAVMGAIAGIGALTEGIGFVAMAVAVAILYLLAGVVDVLANSMKTASGAVTEFGKALSDYFNEKAMTEVANSIDILVDSVAKGMTTLTETIKQNGWLATIAMVGIMKNLTTESAKALGVSSPSTIFFEIAMWVIRGFIDGLKKFGLDLNTGLGAVGILLFQGFIDTVRNVLQTHSDSKEFIDIALDVINGFKNGILDNLTMGIFGPGKMFGNTFIDGVKTGLGDLLNGKLQNTVGGSLTNLFGGFDITKLFGTKTDDGGGFSGLIEGYFGNLTGNFSVEDFKKYADENNLGLSTLSDDGIAQITEAFKDAGLSGDKLVSTLTELGFSVESIKNQGLDVSNVLGTDKAVEGLSQVSSEVQNVVDKIIKGEFGNAPKRWDEMYSYFIKQGKTAKEAYAAIAEAQNEVNKKLGSKVVHTAEEIEKKVSSSAKKANEEAAKLNESKKEEAKAEAAVTAEKDKQIAKTEEQKKELDEINDKLLAQKIAIKKSIEAGDGMTDTLLEEYNQLKEQKEAIEDKIKAQNESAKTVEESTNKATDAQNKQTEAVKQTTEEIKKQAEEVKKVKEELEKPTHLTISNSVKYGSQEYEDLKSDMSINTKTTSRDERFGAKTATAQAKEYVQEVKKSWEKEAKEINLTPVVNVEPEVNTKFETTKLQPIKTETDKTVKDFMKDYEVEPIVSVSPGYEENKSKVQETGAAITQTLLNDPKAKLVNLGKDIVANTTDDMKNSSDKFAEAGKTDAKAYEEAFEDELGYYFKNLKGEWEWQSAKDVVPSMSGVGWAYQMRSQGIPSEDMYKPSEISAAQKASSEKAKQQAVSDAKETTAEIAKTIVSATESNSSKVMEAGAKLGEKIVTGISENNSKLKTEGEKSATQYADGLSSNKVPKSKYLAPANNARSELGSKEQIEKYGKLGENATKGYGNGMTSKSALDYVRKAGNTVAITSRNSMQTALDEHSPSKVMYGIGAYAIKGFINGLLSMVSQVATASMTIGDASINAITPVIGGIQNAVDSGLEITPVITPVINGSNIQNDLNAINSILGQRHIASITENIQATQDYKLQESAGLESRMNNMQNAINSLSTAMLNQPTPEVTANVVLQGDAGGVFKIVQDQGQIYRKMHGKSAWT